MTVGLPTLPSSEQPSRPRAPRAWLAVALVVLVAGGSAAAWWQMQGRDAGDHPNEGPRAAALDDSTARAPSSTRIRVRVINVSGVAGLARRTTQHLRDYGFDVVDFGSGPKERGGTTRIAVHTGHDDWARRVSKALGVGTIVSSPDDSCYADLTVFVGNDWRPTAETLRP